ncbi:DUF4276 family protein [Pseudofrankia sp. DC12]|uniref:DUF4276 family protein n=1 Tax=Pseudofrankia sp. DC12 TaxID=683315 RepID=UPI0005F7B541|nr:DUF4276 family protein [Pseudofrankia sp. DC12]
MTTAGPEIATVVEGEGEVAALPILLRRLAHHLGHWTARFPKPHRHHRGKLLSPGGLERVIDQVTLLNPFATGILVLLDADDDCPAALAPSLLTRARQARPDRRVAVVLPNREFEAWFLAAAPSLAGVRGLPADLKAHPDPESPRDCKGWLTHQRTDGHSYRPTVDQSALASEFDLETARQHAPSFDKFCRDVESLLTGSERL